MPLIRIVNKNPIPLIRRLTKKEKKKKSKIHKKRKENKQTNRRVKNNDLKMQSKRKGKKQQGPSPYPKKLKKTGKHFLLIRGC